MLLLFSTVLASQTTLTHFQHTHITTASEAQVWKIWCDVPGWHRWDTGLKSAVLKGVFEEGAKGKLTPDKGPRTRFVITDLKTGKAYTLKTRIPFGWLKVRRSMTTIAGKTHFTHDVEFTGLFRRFFARKFGDRYRSLLPQVMQNIANLAEQG